MENAAVLTLAGLCLGIAATGLVTVVTGTDRSRAQLYLGTVFVAFIAMVALPLVKTFAVGLVVYYLPLVLVPLLALPPAFYHYVVARTRAEPAPQVPWRDKALPTMGVAVCLGFWALPAETKATMFLEGELPEGHWPAALALMTFVMIFCWILASFAYVIAILRRLTAYRARVRQLYTDVERRDLRWVDAVMILLVMTWGMGALSLAVENLGSGAALLDVLLLGLTACSLLVLNLFAPITPTYSPPGPDEDEPDLKYARSALTPNHTARLALRIEAAMRKDALYLDPSLSLQKLSQHIGAVPNHVSQTLNQEIGATFFDYVAQWRIEASKPLIQSGNDSVLAVALEVGFNSRSTFYKAFKRETDMTPKEFRATRASTG